jgi:hypothetical protein
MAALFDGSETAITFTNSDDVFVKSLGFKFPEEEIVEESSFSGVEAVTIIGKWTSTFVKAIAEFLTAAKKTEAARQIEITVGKNRIKLSGFGGDDLSTMENSLNSLIRELHDPSRQNT